jgi:hypothetical protein
MAGIEALLRLDAPARQRITHWGIKRGVASSDAVARFLEQARERTHARASDSNQMNMHVCSTLALSSTITPPYKPGDCARDNCPTYG